MDNLLLAVGSMGSYVSLGTRVFQLTCSISALFFMLSAVGFYQNSSFCTLAVVMCLLIPWSLILTIVEVFFILVRAPTYRPRIILVVVIIDWIFATMSLATSCATTSLANFMNSSNGTLYHMSAIMTFFCSMLLFGSTLSNLWILPRLL